MSLLYLIVRHPENNFQGARSGEDYVRELRELKTM